jgi:hypothetical protein
MTSENDLIQKLMISKQIMEKHNQTPRGGLPSMDTYNTPEVATYDAPVAKYNLPQDMLQEASVPVQTVTQPMTQDRVMASKLPDEIKRLMIEHPITQPAGMGGPTLSNDLIDKAARLMNADARGNQVGQPKQRLQEQSQPQSNFNNKQLRDMLKEVVEEVLQENGILAESTQKSNEVFSFKVGKHIFEGKVTKIKKIS